MKEVDMAYLLAGLIFLMISVFSVLPSMMLDIKYNKSHVFKDKNIEVRMKESATRFETVYLKNYDYLNLPLNKIPNAGLAENKSSMSIFLEKINSEKIILNGEKVCKPFKNSEYRCVRNDDSIYDIISYDKGKEAVKSLINSVSSSVFLDLSPLTLSYAKNDFPSLKMKIYHSKEGNRPDISKFYEVNINETVNSMIISAKNIMDEMYEQYGESIKRRHKGYYKTEIVSAYNPFAVLGDGIDVVKSSKIKKDSSDPTGYITYSRDYYLVGNKYFEGWMTSDSMLMSFAFLDKGYSSILPSGGKVLDLSMNITNNNPSGLELSNKYFYLVKDVRRYLKSKCDRDDIGCSVTITDPNITIESFCLSTEPCYVIYEMEKEVLKSVKAMSTNYYFEKKFNLGYNSYTNPFYPNYKDTLDESEQKGLVVSANNQGIPTNATSYFFLLGLKYIPTPDNFKNHPTENEENYIINKYVIQAR